MGDVSRREVTKEWERLRRKYKLPKLQEIEKEIGFYLTSKPVISEALKGIARILNSISLDIEAVLYPKDLAGMIEKKFFTEEERERLYDFYREIRSKLCKVPIAVMGEEREKVSLFKELLKFYREKARSAGRQFYERLSKGWREKSKGKEKITYLR